MANLMRLGRHFINPDFITAIEEVRTAGPDGKGRQVRLDMAHGQPQYIGDPEALKQLDAIIRAHSDRPMTREEK